MKGTDFLILAGVAGAIFFLGKKKVVKKATGMAKFEIKKVFLRGLNPVIRIGVLNPSNQSITINSFVGGLLLNDNSEVAKVKNFKRTQIKASAESDFELTLVPSSVGVFQALKTIFSKKLGDMNIKLVGNANVNGMVLPINLRF